MREILRNEDGRNIKKVGWEKYYERRMGDRQRKEYERNIKKGG